ncbi:hypothetical protein [Aquamicrobium defluvii]|nr:hypothetical protein [Aquamicrobium defluvii]
MNALTAAGYVILSPDEVRGIRDEALEEAAKEAKIGWVTADYDTVGIVDADKAMALCEHIEIAIHSLKGGRDVT